MSSCKWRALAVCSHCLRGGWKHYSKSVCFLQHTFTDITICVWLILSWKILEVESIFYTLGYNHSYLLIDRLSRLGNFKKIAWILINSTNIYWCLCARHHLEDWRYNNERKTKKKNRQTLPAGNLHSIGELTCGRHNAKHTVDIKFLWPQMT